MVITFYFVQSAENKEVYAKELVERLRRDHVAVICRDSNPVTTVYTVIAIRSVVTPYLGM